MNCQLSLIALALPVSLLVLSAPVQADHADVFASSSLGQLTTGGWDDATEALVAASQRVFAAETGEDPGFPFATSEPGIHSDLGGSTISLNVLAGLGAWNGARFDAAPSASLHVEYGPQNACTLDGGSLSFFVTQGFHVHPSWIFTGLLDSDPAPGIYLASFTLSGAGYADSDPFWIVFNVGRSEADHDAAISWVETNLVPAPGVLALLSVAGAGSRTRCSRQRGRS